MRGWDLTGIRAWGLGISRTTLGYDDVVKMTEKELIERLAEADWIRATLRRCTLEWRALGDRILSERQGGSERPNDGRVTGR